MLFDRPNISDAFAGEDDWTPPSALSSVFEEEPVDLDTFIQDRKFLGLSSIQLSEVQSNAVRHIERIYYPELYPLMAEEFDDPKLKEYWGLDLPVKNLITLQWGKGCKVGTMPIYDARTGSWVPVSQWRGGHVAGADDAGTVGVHEASESWVSGTGDCYRVTTAYGLVEEVYAGHRYLVRDRIDQRGGRTPRKYHSSWKQLRQISVGDFIAVPNTIPEPTEPLLLQDEEVELLGLLLGDGCLPSREKKRYAVQLTVSVEDTEVTKRFTEIVEDFGGSVSASAAPHRINLKAVGTGKRGENPIIELVRAHGMDGHEAYTKKIPEAIYRLSNRQIALFLSRLIDTDGHIYVPKSESVPEVGYTTASYDLAVGVQRLMLRLGCRAQIQNKKIQYKGESRTYYCVRMRDRTNVAEFCRQIVTLSKEEDRTAALESCSSGNGKTRARQGDLAWDRIVSIEPIGEMEYWDLEVPGVQNYVSNGTLNHNSGKDAIARFSSLRVAYLLLCMKSPQEYFGIPDFDSFHLLNIAANSKQAMNAFFNPMREATKRGWFKDKAEPKQDVIQYDKHVMAISGHSDAESQEGLNIMLGVADEIDAFKAKNEMVGLGSRAREASTSAESILKMLKGSASAQPLDAKVLTPSGWTTMGELKVGDRVVDPMGDTSSIVTGIFPQGVTPVYELTFSDGSITRASHHHLWQVEYSWTPTTVEGRKNKTSKSVEKTVTTEWLVENLPKFQRWKRPIKIVRSKLHEYDFQGEALPISPYLLGALLGDGGLTHYTPTFTSADQEMFDLIASELPSGVSFSKYIQHVGCRSVRLVSGKGRKNPLTASLEALELWGKHSYDKFIPEVYKWSSAANRLALLQGLLDTDGTVGKTGAVFGTTSERLAKDVRDLARSLGLPARLSSPIEPRTSSWVGSDGRTIQGKRLSWKVSIGRAHEFDLFRIARKVEKQPTTRTQRHAYSIRSIARIEDDVTQCIKVSAESELYVTDDFVVTHNTRFPRTYKRVTISYPRYIGSTIQQQTDEGNASIKEFGEKSIHFVSGPLATWDVNPRIKGKEDFAEDYLKDPDEAASMYECRPTRAVDAYFRNPVIFQMAIDRAEQPIAVDYQIAEHTSKSTGQTVRGWEPVFTFSPDFQPVPGARYAMHGDLAIRGDRAGVAMTHVEEWQDRVTDIIAEDGSISKRTEVIPTIRNDFTIAFSADTSARDEENDEPLPREIQIRWARALAFELIKRGFYIASFTFDGFQSADTIQILESHGIESGKISTDRDPDIWKTVKDVASDARLRMPYSALLIQELESLSRVGKGKVDHPPTGSKDLADAFACSIVGAIEAGGEESPEGEPLEIGAAFFDAGEVLSPLDGMMDHVFEMPFGMKGMSLGGH